MARKPSDKPAKPKTTKGKAGKKTTAARAPKKPVQAKPQARQANTAREATRPQGGQTKYTEDLANEILGRMAGGETVNQICRDLEVKGTKIAPSTVRLWVLDNREGFAERYARARDMMLDYWAEDTIDIADDGRNDWAERQNSDGSTYTVVDHEHISRSKVRIDTRKWILSKLKPERYGDKVEIDTPADGGIAQAAAVTMGALAALARPKP